jgi:hypothetical protein
VRGWRGWIAWSGSRGRRGRVDSQGRATRVQGKPSCRVWCRRSVRCSESLAGAHEEMVRAEFVWEIRLGHGNGQPAHRKDTLHPPHPLPRSPARVGSASAVVHARSTRAQLCSPSRRPVHARSLALAGSRSLALARVALDAASAPHQALRRARPTGCHPRRAPVARDVQSPCRVAAPVGTPTRRWRLRSASRCWSRAGRSRGRSSREGWRSALVRP